MCQRAECAGRAGEASMRQPRFGGREHHRGVPGEQRRAKYLRQRGCRSGGAEQFKRGTAEHECYKSAGRKFECSARDDIDINVDIDAANDYAKHHVGYQLDIKCRCSIHD